MRFPGQKLWCVIGAALACTACSPNPPKKLADQPPQPAHRPIEKARAGFAGADQCRDCHEQEHNSWHHSYHRTMTALPHPDTIKGDFEHEAIDAYGMICRPVLGPNNRFGFDLQQSGITRQVDVALLTGSHQMQAYWISTGEMRALTLVPILYLIDEQRWIPRDAAFLRPPIKVRNRNAFQWSANCIRCHATAAHPGYEFSDPTQLGKPTNMDTHAAEFGISCEACHGAAAEHVRLRKQFPDWQDQPDPIVHPTELNAERSSEVCGQCHGINLFDDNTFANSFYTEGEVYSPGEALANAGRSIWNERDQPRHPNAVVEKRSSPGIASRYFWRDGMVRVSGREYNGLINSPCYTHQDEAQRMTCLSCHEMHPSKRDNRPLETWANDQLKPKMYGNAACLQCHNAYEDTETLTAHTHHPADSAGSVCYNCHMPYTTYGLLKAIRSHTVSSPTALETLTTGRPTACNQCHLDKSLDWTASYLEQWYQLAGLRLSEEQQFVPASLVALLKGDAGQRALSAWAMGWETARATSGTNWIPRALTELLDDPYDAVRFIAERSLRRDPLFTNWSYDFMAPPEQRQQAAAQAVQLWQKHQQATGGFTALYDWINPPTNTLPREIIPSLKAQRDDRSVHLLE